MKLAGFTTMPSPPHSVSIVTSRCPWFDLPDRQQLRIVPPGIRMPQFLNGGLARIIQCAVKGVVSSAGANPARQLSFQPVAIGAAVEVTKPPEPSMAKGRFGDSASRQAVTRVNAEQASKRVMWEPTRLSNGEGQRRWGRRTSKRTQRSHRGSGDGMLTGGGTTKHGKPQRWRRVTANRKPARDRPGRAGVAERLVVPSKPGNAGGGKGPQFKVNVTKEPRAGRLAMSLTPPPKVAEAPGGVACQSEECARVIASTRCTTRCIDGTCWTCAYARCRANGGAPGVDGQTFEDIEEYGGENVAGRTGGGTQERRRIDRSRSGGCTSRKPDGKQRPLGIPTIRDRVVQMAAVLVLEPIFEADLQPEQYAYRPDRSALDAVQAGPCAW